MNVSSLMMVVKPKHEGAF